MICQGKGFLKSCIKIIYHRISWDILKFITFYHVFCWTLNFSVKNLTTSCIEKIPWRFIKISFSNIFHYQFMKKALNFNWIIFFFVFILRQLSAWTYVMFNNDVTLGKNSQWNIKHFITRMVHVSTVFWAKHVNKSYKLYFEILFD